MAIEALFDMLYGFLGDVVVVRKLDGSEYIGMLMGLFGYTGFEVVAECSVNCVGKCFEFTAVRAIGREDGKFVITVS